MFFYGGSFGGRTSIRHAELYPNDFDGYISHDGVLSFSMVNRSDNPHHSATQVRKYVGEWLDPANEEEIVKINKPILLLHNRDDNNVNIKVTLDFYNKAKSVLKRKRVPIQLQFFEKGNAMPQGSESNKGHFLPTDKKEFSHYLKTLLTFMLQGPSQVRAASEWRAHYSDTIANKNYKSSSLDDLFLAEAYGLYRKNKKIQLETKRDFDQVWNRLYLPLYRAYIFVNQLKVYRLDNVDSINNEKIEKTLKRIVPNFLEYLQENFDFKFPEISTKEVIKSPNLIKQFHASLTHADDESADNRLLLLKEVYLANPELLPHMEIQPEELNAMKTKLKETFDTGSILARTAIKRAAKKSIKLKRDELLGPPISAKPMMH